MVVSVRPQRAQPPMFAPAWYPLCSRVGIPFLIWYRYSSALQIAGSFLIGCAEQFQVVDRNALWLPVRSVFRMYGVFSLLGGVVLNVFQMFMTVESPASAGESITMFAGAYLARIALASSVSWVCLAANRSWKGSNQYIPLAAPAAALITGGAEHGSIDRTGLVLPRLLRPVRIDTHCDGSSSRKASGWLAMALARVEEALDAFGGIANSFAVPPEAFTDGISNRFA